MRLKMKFGLKEDIIKQIKEIVSKNSKYRFKLFGSRARNRYKATSDIDIAIFKNVSKEDEYKIRDEFDRLDIIYKIDLVFVDKTIKQELLDSIQRDGVDF